MIRSFPSMLLAGLLFAGLLLAAPQAMAESRQAPTVEAPAGAVSGELLDGDIRAFRGIPYAQAPVGQLRWRPPVAAERWDGVRDATRFGPACPQPPPRLPPRALFGDD